MKKAELIQQPCRALTLADGLYNEVALLIREVASALARGKFSEVPLFILTDSAGIHERLVTPIVEGWRA